MYMYTGANRIPLALWKDPKCVSAADPQCYCDHNTYTRPADRTKNNKD
jgi:hypothetical protein